MKIAFVKATLQLPARSGDDVHAPGVAGALQRLGHEVRLIVGQATGASLAPVPVEEVGYGEIPGIREARRLPPLWRRFYTYFGGPEGMLPLADTRRLDREFDAVVAVGPEMLLVLGLLEQSCRVWYAADELVLSQVSQYGIRPRQVKCLATKCLLERCLGRSADDIWVVSDREKRWMRRIAGHGRATVVPNGVDTDHYSPRSIEQDAERLVFWGRLDFRPNIEALRWFLRRVWPRVRAMVPTASFHVIGSRPSDELRKITHLAGVELFADVPDLRDMVCAAPIAVFPFVSGAGIKNKVLEGAALARALVLSPRAATGLQTVDGENAFVCRRPADWVRTLVSLMRDPARVAHCGVQARAWVASEHTWDRAGELAETSIRSALARRARELQFQDGGASVSQMLTADES